MKSRLPTKKDIVFKATERPITQDEASDLTSAESNIKGRGPVKGGPAATAQMLHDRPMDPKLPDTMQLEADFADRHVTQTEASAVASAESHITGRGPIKGGPAATAQSVHDRQRRS